MPKFNRRDRTEVSCVIKYLVFGFNVAFWLLGGLIAAVGVWAWTEKDMFTKLSRIAQVQMDPATIFIIAGGVIFLIGFTGCVGALRENTVLLLIYCVCIGIIFFAEVVVGVLAFVYRDWLRTEMKKQLGDMIRDYREDADLQNLIDWVQQDWLKCCGVENPRDWDKNIYFNCTAPTREKCGVPFSCCIKADGDSMPNKQCGYDTRDRNNQGKLIKTKNIHGKGCLEAGEIWLNQNLIPVAGVAVAVALIQILGICFAQNLRSDIEAQKAKWR